MTNKTKKGNRTPNTIPTSTSFRLKGSEWLALPLGILALVCLYVVGSTMQSFSPSFTSPTIVSLLVGIFSAIYVYKVLKTAPRHPVATAIAYIFSVFLVILAGVLNATSGNECGSDCNTSTALVAWIIAFNPYAAMLWSPLAIIGIVLIIVKRSR